jgi:hypothetical protein
MKKNLLTVMALLLLIGCSQPAESLPPASSQPQPPPEADVRTDVAFVPEPIEEAQIELLVFSPHAPEKPGYYIDLLPEAAFVAHGGDVWSENYTVIEPSGIGSMSISLLSCPSDPLDYFDLASEEELTNKLIAYIFPTGDRHRGQQRAVADFEYTLTVDHSGTREGWQAYIIEFEDRDTQTHSIRFLSANDDIGEHYTGIAVNINLPMGETAAYEAYMQMLHSIRRAES